MLRSDSLSACEQENTDGRLICMVSIVAGTEEIAIVLLCSVEDLCIYFFQL